MTKKKTDSGPEYHGVGLKAARERAKRIRGVVILSTAPSNMSAVLPDHPHRINARGSGYWSDDADALIHPWETVVYESKR
jgi:hypothetical protein